MIRKIEALFISHFLICRFSYEKPSLELKINLFLRSAYLLICFSFMFLFFITHRGVYNLVDPRPSSKDKQKPEPRELMSTSLQKMIRYNFNLILKYCRLVK